MLETGLLTTNQAVGNSNLSGRAIFLFKTTDYSVPLGRFFSCLSNRAKNIHLIGQMLSLHAFPVYATSLSNYWQGSKKLLSMGS
jgi:hypothetical protein